VFDKVGVVADAWPWKWSAGGGVRIGWNRSTIVMFDLGASTEDIGFYVDFGMPF
jgi:hypothetical protein